MAQLYNNNAASTLASSLAIGATSLTVVTGAGALFASISAGNYQMLTLDDGTNIEIVKATARSTDTLTIVRAQEGTTARAWAAGAIVEARLTAAAVTRFEGKPDNEGAGIFAVAFGTLSAAPYDYSVSYGYDAQCAEPAAWAASSYYLKNAIVLNAAGTVAFMAAANLTTGATEPTWSTDRAASTADGTGNWISIGPYNWATDNLGQHAFGRSSRSYADDGIAVGYYAAAANKASAIGDQSFACSYSVAVGTMASAQDVRSIAIGESAACAAGTTWDDSSGYNIAIGYNASTSCQGDGIAIGDSAINRIGWSYVITGMSLIRKDTGESGYYTTVRFVGAKSVIFSKEIDLTATAADDVVDAWIPDGATFYPDEIGLLITAADTVTGQPSVSFGVTGNTVALLASTATTKNTTKARDFFTLLSRDGVNTLTASVKTAATATTLKGRFFWEGVLVEDE